MRTIAAVVATALFLTPAIAADCSFVNSELGRVTFLDPASPNGPEFTYEHADGAKETCSWLHTDEGTTLRLSCPSVEDFGSFAGLTPDDHEQALMAWQDEVWYRRCD